MITANELRVGNLVQTKKGLATVLTIMMSEAMLNSVEDETLVEYFHKLDGIPLTPEVLERCGFVLATKRTAIYIKDRLQLWLGHNGALTYWRNEDKNEAYWIGDVKHLHELQNLYFALTKKELEYAP